MRCCITLRLLLPYLPSCFLVLVYVHLFRVRAWLEVRTGREVLDLLPILSVLVAGAVILAGFRLRIRKNGTRIGWLWLGLGSGLVLVALWLPDGRFPAKRFHVVEYLLLSLTVRAAMSRHLQGQDLPLFSWLATAILGMHDELLQGIHPLRTYGLADMGVNALSAAAGSLFWHGMRLFHRRADSRPKNATSHRLLQGVYLAWLSFALLAMAVPLAWYRDSLLPFWPLMPLAAALCFWLLYRGELASPPQGHGILVVSWFSFPMLLYPVLINGSSYSFH